MEYLFLEAVNTRKEDIIAEVISLLSHKALAAKKDAMRWQPVRAFAGNLFDSPS